MARSNAPDSLAGKDHISDDSQEVVNEKETVTVLPDKLDHEIQPVGNYGVESDRESADVVIVTGADAALHLLPLRDDFDRALTVRSMFLATGLSCFSAVMYQIYQVGEPL